MYRFVRPHDAEFMSCRCHPTHSGSAGPGYMQSAVCNDIVSFVVIGCDFAALLYCMTVQSMYCMSQSLSPDLSCLIVLQSIQHAARRDIASGMVASTHSVVPNPQVRLQSAVS
ncbi:TPA: hypothetical protein ACH3X1_004597 [Trebouxia sp. C0004]